MDHPWNNFQLLSTAVQYGVDSVATEKESLLVQKIIREGSKASKRNLHNLVRIRGAEATVKDNQKRKYITLAIGMWKYKELFVQLFDIIRNANAFEVISTPTLWDSDTVEELLFKLEGSTVGGVAQADKTSDR